MSEPKPYWYLNEAEMEFWDPECLFHDKVEGGEIIIPATVDQVLASGLITEEEAHKYKVEEMMATHRPGWIDNELITASDWNEMIRDNCLAIPGTNNINPHYKGEIEEQEIKHYCSWCSGMTFDDSHGHCCACGGMREKEDDPQEDMLHFVNPALV